MLCSPGSVNGKLLRLYAALVLMSVVKPFSSLRSLHCWKAAQMLMWVSALAFKTTLFLLCVSRSGAQARNQHEMCLFHCLPNHHCMKTMHVCLAQFMDKQKMKNLKKLKKFKPRQTQATFQN